MALPTGLPLRRAALTLASRDSEGVVASGRDAVPAEMPRLLSAAPTPAFRSPASNRETWSPLANTDCFMMRNIPFSHSFSPSTDRIRCCIAFAIAVSCSKVSSDWNSCVIVESATCSVKIQIYDWKSWSLANFRSSAQQIPAWVCSPFPRLCFRSTFLWNL